MSRIEQFKFNGGNVNPRHAGLCEFNTNEKQRKEGPFMNFDIAASFKMPEDGLPTSCQFTLLRVRDAGGKMHEVELDLNKPHACLTATIGGGIISIIINIFMLLFIIRIVLIWLLHEQDNI